MYMYSLISLLLCFGWYCVIVMLSILAIRITGFGGIVVADSILVNFLKSAESGGVQSLMDVYWVAVFYDSGILDWGRLVEPDDFRSVLVGEFVRSISDAADGVVGGGVLLWLKNISFGVDDVLDAISHAYVNRLVHDVESLAYLYRGVLGNDYVCVHLRGVVFSVGMMDEFIGLLGSRYGVELSRGEFFDGLPEEYQLGVVL